MRDGESWFQRYERGQALAPLARVGATSQHGTSLRFRFDPDVFGATRLDASSLAQRIAMAAGPVADRIVLPPHLPRWELSS